MSIYMHYTLYGFHIVSDIPFPQLIPASDCTADITIVRDNVSEQLPQHTPDIRYDFGYDISWLENNTCYLLAQNGSRITYEPKENASIAYLRNYILGWGISMLATQLGMPAIHCSAISHHGSAILFCGESGIGKSTLTSSYIKKGYQLMADDMALVEYRDKEGAWVHGSFPYQKLCRDAALRSCHSLDELIYVDELKDKFLVPCHDIFDSTVKPLRALILLTYGDTDRVCIHKVQGLPAFGICVDNLFLRHLLHDRRYEPFIAERCLKIASCIQVYVITRPYGKDTIQEVITAAQSITYSLEE